MGPQIKCCNIHEKGATDRQIVGEQGLLVIIKMGGILHKIIHIWLRHHIYQMVNLPHSGNHFYVLHAECSLLQAGKSELR
jgi:hypothetical protein